MSVTSGRTRLRVTVSGPAELVVELPAGADPVAGPPLADAVPLRSDPDEAALGRRRFEVVVDGWRFEVAAEPAHRAALRERAQRAAAEHQPATLSRLTAQIPGRIIRVWVAEGDEVEQGQRLLAIEAMKMENEIRAPRAGRIERLAVGEGGRVELHDELLSIV